MSEKDATAATELDLEAEQIDNDEEIVIPELGKPEDSEKSHSDKLQKRFGRLTAEKYGALERAARAEQEAAELKRRLAEIEADKSEPKFEDFDDVGKYAAAMAKFHTDRAAKANAVQPVDHSQSVEEIGRVFNQHESEARALLPDYDDAVNYQLEIDAGVAYAIREAADNQALLLYALSKKPDLVKELEGLRGAKLVKRIGDIETRVQRSIKAAKAKTESAKPAAASEPLSPLSKGNTPAGGTGKTPSANMSTAEWMAARNAQLGIRGRR